MKSIINRIITKFSSARFIMVLAFTFTTCYLAIKGEISGESLMGIYGSIVGFYFSKSRENNNKI